MSEFKRDGWTRLVVGEVCQTGDVGIEIKHATPGTVITANHVPFWRENARHELSLRSLVEALQARAQKIQELEAYIELLKVSRSERERNRQVQPPATPVKPVPGTAQDSAEGLGARDSTGLDQDGL